MSRAGRCAAAAAVAVAALGIASIRGQTPFSGSPHRRTPTPDSERRELGTTAERRATPHVVGEPAAAAARSGPFVPFFDAAPRTGDLGRIARDLIDENRDALGLAAMPGELRVKREFDSLSGRHLRFEQTVNGVPVFGSEVSSHVAKNGRPLLVQADVFPVEGAATAPRISPARARAEAIAWMRDDGTRESVETKIPRLLLLPEGRRGRLVWRVDARTTSDSSRIFIDATAGGVVRSDSLRTAANGTGVIFDPNPIVALRDGSLTDGRDDDTGALTGALVLVVLPRLDGSGYLRGPWVDLTSTAGATQQSILNWGPVTRSDPAFEQVMSYFHADRLQQRFQDLGITNVNAEPQNVDAHAVSEDQSYYDSFNDVLRFGDGGVDDAEDADIIRHEYGHAIHYDQVEDYGLTSEGSAIGEGFGDFVAAVDHAKDPLFEPLVGCWDASSYSKSTPPYLRRTDTNKRFPGDLKAEPHADGELWSRLLWDIRALLGKDDALRLVLESHFMYTSSVRFSQAVNSLLLTNIAIRGGADDVALRDLIEARGFVYSVPLANPPPDDAYEPNNDVDHPAALQAVPVPGLVSVDDDWYVLRVPPNRRWHVTLSNATGLANLDMTLFARFGPTSLTNELIQMSDAVSGDESVDASAGPAGATYLLRVFDAAIGTHVAQYDLNVIDADLEALAPGRSTLTTLAQHAPDVFRVEVPASKVGGQLKVTTKRHRKAGATAEFRVTAPDGTLVLDFGQAEKGGTHAAIPLASPGAWTVEVRSRDGVRGRAKVRVAFQ